MISRKSREELKLMRHAGSIVALVHQEMKKVICEGISTLELDEIAHRIIRENKAIPTFLGYHGYPASICTSVNEQVVHGIPSKDVVLHSGDIVSIDVGATFRGLVGDGAWTYPVGEISDDKKMLLETTEKALMAGVARMMNGNLLEEVSAAIEDVALSKNLGIVRQYGGHGVGHSMHEDPFVFNYRTGNKTILKTGMTIAIEPMLNLGKDDVYVLDDDWTVVTRDGSLAAHYEHTIVITSDGYEILTKL